MLQTLMCLVGHYFCGLWYQQNKDFLVYRIYVVETVYNLITLDNLELFQSLLQPWSRDHQRPYSQSTRTTYGTVNY